MRSLIRNNRGDSLVSYGMILGLVVVAALPAVNLLGKHIEGTYHGMVEQISDGKTGPGVVRYSSPCPTLYETGAREDGLYPAEASDGSEPLLVACNFETQAGLEGGWTVVAHQLDANPEINWSQGISTDRAAEGYFSTSFTLNTPQMPRHSVMAVGRRLSNGNFEILDAVNAGYSTGSINYTGANAVESLTVPGRTYEVHRSASAYYCGHDPENGASQSGDAAQMDTLTFDLFSDPDTGTAQACGQTVDMTWAFSPNQTPELAGHAYEGYRGATTEPYSWIVLVR